jgi:protein ImuB
MLWIALYYPTLALDCIRRRLPETVEPPMALVESLGSRRWIQATNTAAQTEGVSPGLALATALALYPALLLFEHDSAAEARALDEAALAALRFTPAVSLAANGLLLEVEASVRLFRGIDTLIAQLLATQDSLGLNAALGVAATARGAWLIARAPLDAAARCDTRADLATRLAGLPVALLDSAQAHLGVLEGIGCQRLGQLQRLPRAGLARRFGAALLDELDRAYGAKADPQIWVVAAERFEARIELMARSESVEALLFVTQRLMAQLAGWLAARQAATNDLVLTLYHEHWRREQSRATVLRIGLAQPSRDPHHLLVLVRERLTRCELCAPVEELSLSANDLCRSAPLNSELFPTAHSSAVTLNRLTEKLVARLGTQSISHPSSNADHRPEKAWRDSTTAHPPGTAAALAARPAWLMREPQALALEGPRPVYGTALAFLAGPERIEAGWWDDALVARDYYVAENELGQRLWIYRERHAHAPRNAWFLHGVLA